MKPFFAKNGSTIIQTISDVSCWRNNMHGIIRLYYAGIVTFLSMQASITSIDNAEARTWPNAFETRTIGAWQVTESVDHETGENRGYCKFEQKNLTVRVNKGEVEIELLYTPASQDRPVILEFDHSRYTMRRTLHAPLPPPPGQEVYINDPLSVVEISKNNREWFPVTSLLAPMLSSNHMTVRNADSPFPDRLNLRGLRTMLDHCQSYSER